MKTQGGWEVDANVLKKLFELHFKITLFFFTMMTVTVSVAVATSRVTDNIERFTLKLLYLFK